MKPNQVLPSVPIPIDVGAAFVCLFTGGVRRFVYWLSAAVLTATVTF